MSNLLAIGSDAKTVKGEKYNILTGILYLAPYDVSGYQVCPKASAGCAAACLYSAGRGVYQNVQNGRIRKTKLFFENRPEFLTTLVKNIEALVRKAKREDMLPAVRLNGTSDIAWEKIKLIRNGVIYRNVMEAFPDVEFYDYTKILGRKAAIALPNYSLTFSLAEDNDADAVAALEQGYNVAVVMEQGRKKAPKPAQWGGYPVIDGDESDLRFLDEKGGHIIALAAKGKARKDTTGFVRDVDGGFNVTESIPLRFAA